MLTSAICRRTQMASLSPWVLGKFLMLPHTPPFFARMRACRYYNQKVRGDWLLGGAREVGGGVSHRGSGREAAAATGSRSTYVKDHVFFPAESGCTLSFWISCQVRMLWDYVLRNTGVATRLRFFLLFRWLSELSNSTHIFHLLNKDEMIFFDMSYFLQLCLAIHCWLTPSKTMCGTLYWSWVAGTLNPVILPNFCSQWDVNPASAFPLRPFV